LNNTCSHFRACERINHAICFNNKCQCNWNYFEDERRNCVGGLHAICSDGDCQSPAYKCVKERCTCADDYVESVVPSVPAEDTIQCGAGEALVYGTCVKYATKLGESCEKSFLACKGIPNSYCSIDKTCQCRWKYIAVSDKCYPRPNAPCDFTKFNECHFAGAKCSNITHKCECDSQRYYYQGYCLIYAKELDKVCHHDYACQRIKNSECVEKKCKCREEFQQVGRNCVARLHAPCELDQDCNSSILNSECSKSNHRCSYLYATCTTPFSCKTRNSICRDGSCQCDWNYVKRGIYCVSSSPAH
ncbi:hypothetical protein KQX54_003973, partial [Cotesia glomerata]